MPAVSWYDNRADEELLRVATLLERMAHEDDIRKVIFTRSSELSLPQNPKTP
jgi:hypothetical protein